MQQNQQRDQPRRESIVAQQKDNDKECFETKLDENYKVKIQPWHKTWFSDFTLCEKSVWFSHQHHDHDDDDDDNELSYRRDVKLFYQTLLDMDHLSARLRDWAPFQSTLQCIYHPSFQRLKEISQHGLYNCCYGVLLQEYSDDKKEEENSGLPRRSRYQHSINVARLARLVGEHLRTTQPELELEDMHLECLELAGLLHDIGHLPFSHTFDEFIRFFLTEPLCKLRHKRTHNTSKKEECNDEEGGGSGATNNDTGFRLHKFAHHENRSCAIIDDMVPDINTHLKRNYDILNSIDMSIVNSEINKPTQQQQQQQPNRKDFIDDHQHQYQTNKSKINTQHTSLDAKKRKKKKSTQNGGKTILTREKVNWIKFLIRPCESSAPDPKYAFLGQLISHPKELMDVDRMEYLMMDFAYSGIPMPIQPWCVEDVLCRSRIQNHQEWVFDYHYDAMSLFNMVASRTFLHTSFYQQPFQVLVDQIVGIEMIQRRYDEKHLYCHNTKELSVVPVVNDNNNKSNTTTSHLHHENSVRILSKRNSSQKQHKHSRVCSNLSTKDMEKNQKYWHGVLKDLRTCTNLKESTFEPVIESFIESLVIDNVIQEKTNSRVQQSHLDIGKNINTIHSYEYGSLLDIIDQYYSQKSGGGDIQPFDPTLTYLGLYIDSGSQDTLKRAWVQWYNDFHSKEIGRGMKSVDRPIQTSSSPMDTRLKSQSNSVVFRKRWQLFKGAKSPRSILSHLGFYIARDSTSPSKCALEIQEPVWSRESQKAHYKHSVEELHSSILSKKTARSSLDKNNHIPNEKTTCNGMDIVTLHSIYDTLEDVLPNFQTYDDGEIYHVFKIE